MGFYVNPHEMSKEEFLKLHGREITDPFFPENENEALVCLVQNPMFSAAAIAYREEEMMEFAEFDGRPKKWYIVPKEKICPRFIQPEMFGIGK